MKGLCRGPVSVPAWVTQITHVNLMPHLGQAALYERAMLHLEMGKTSQVRVSGLGEGLKLGPCTWGAYVWRPLQALLRPGLSFQAITGLLQLLKQKPGHLRVSLELRKIVLGSATELGSSIKETAATTVAQTMSEADAEEITVPHLLCVFDLFQAANMSQEYLEVQELFCVAMCACVPAATWQIVDTATLTYHATSVHPPLVSQRPPATPRTKRHWAKDYPKCAHHSRLGGMFLAFRHLVSFRDRRVDGVFAMRPKRTEGRVPPLSPHIDAETRATHATPSSSHATPSSSHATPSSTCWPGLSRHRLTIFQVPDTVSPALLPSLVRAQVTVRPNGPSVALRLAQLSHGPAAKVGVRGYWVA